MPHQNRVTPFSTIIATPARGTLMGNRGRLHDDQGRIRRAFESERWIVCQLSFKDHKRSVMTPGLYTELFFLDEVTALTAGHRPCAECQWERFDLFRATWAKANPDLASAPRPLAATLDAALHRERLAGRQDPVRVGALIEELPDGAFVTDDGANAYLVRGRKLYPWTPSGYGRSFQPSARCSYRLLTPPSIVQTLAAGYPAEIHEST
jgi:hypothetical protein